METVETNRHRGFFSLLCGTINIKKNMPCISDDSVAENDASVETCEPPQPHVIAYWRAETEASNDPVVIPSPVLVSKRLAEEAVARRRNVRFKGNGAIDEENSADSASPTQGSASTGLVPAAVDPNEGARASKPRQKRMAPAPPAYTADIADSSDVVETTP